MIENPPDKGVNVYGAKEPVLCWFRAPTGTFRDTSKTWEAVQNAATMAMAFCDPDGMDAVA